MIVVNDKISEEDTLSMPERGAFIPKTVNALVVKLRNL